MAQAHLMLVSLDRDARLDAELREHPTGGGRSSSSIHRSAAAPVTSARHPASAVHRGTLGGCGRVRPRGSAPRQRTASIPYVAATPRRAASDHASPLRESQDDEPRPGILSPSPRARVFERRDRAVQRADPRRESIGTRGVPCAGRLRRDDGDLWPSPCHGARIWRSRPYPHRDRAAQRRPCSRPPRPPRARGENLRPSSRGEAEHSSVRTYATQRHRDPILVGPARPLKHLCEHSLGTPRSLGDAGVPTLARVSDSRSTGSSPPSAVWTRPELG